MNTPSVYACLGFALHALTTASAHGASVDDVAAAVAAGDSAFDFRYRYELVDQNDIDDEARASTLRARFTWTSGEVAGVRAGLEADYVSTVGAERYNSTSNGEAEYPVVADPDGFDLNQAFVAYATEQLSATGGRQRILHGGQRFVGGVGWRQNEQTYDAVRVELAPLDRLKVDYGYVANVNRVFGPDDGAQPADWRSDSHLLTVGFELSPAVAVGAFGYLMDFDNDNGIANSNATFGVEAKATAGRATLSAAVARQTDYADSPLDYRAHYVLLEAAVAVSPVTVTAGYELLGSDDGDAAFRTPLATLHKFQGWADQFLTTPDTGIQDLYLGVQGSAGAFKLVAVYHDFTADEGSQDYGTELDLELTYTITPKASVQLKYADYQADDFASDTVKAWLTVSLVL
jgi:hypothetical protein